MTPEGKSVDLAALIEREAQRLFHDRWPGMAWTGWRTNRAYWRRQAADALHAQSLQHKGPDQ